MIVSRCQHRSRFSGLEGTERAGLEPSVSLFVRRSRFAVARLAADGRLRAPADQLLSSSVRDSVPWDNRTTNGEGGIRDSRPSFRYPGVTTPTKGRKLCPPQTGNVSQLRKKSIGLESDSNRCCNTMSLEPIEIKSFPVPQTAARRRDISLTLAM
jgi:hypothetical protein